MDKDVAPEKPTPVVFIAGCSHSGSTLLGLLLGSDRRGFFAGEVKQYKLRHDLSRAGHERGRCPCGDWVERCDFWSAVHERHPPALDLHPSPGVSRDNLRALVHALRPPGDAPTETCVAYAEVCQAIYREARANDGDVRFVVDSSKSLRSLQCLARAPGIELRVVHLVRDGEAVAASYRRRGKGGVAGMVAWAYSTWAVSAFLRRSQTPSILIRYEDLCNSTDRELDRLNEFLGTELSVTGLAGAVRATRYHGLAGSSLKRRTESFSGLQSNNGRAKLPAFHRALGRVLARPLERCLSDTSEQ